MRTEYRVSNQGGFINVEPGESSVGSSATSVVEIKKIARRFVNDSNGSVENKRNAREQIACWTKADIEEGLAHCDVW